MSYLGLEIATRNKNKNKKTPFLLHWTSTLLLGPGSSEEAGCSDPSISTVPCSL
jgi:hypothetical protein